MTRRQGYGLFAFVLLVFAYALLANAWVVDDAYITFRTVDNLPPAMERDGTSPSECRSTHIRSGCCA